MTWITWTILEWVARLVMVPVILRRRLAPNTALAWLAVIFLLPEVGVPLYWLLSGDRLARKRIRLHRQFVQSLRGRGPASRRWGRERQGIGPQQAAMIQQAERIGGLPIVGGNEVELLGEVRDIVDRLVADIDAAKHHVHLLFYIYRADATGWRVAEALTRARRRGVACRVLADAVGSWKVFRRRGLAAEMNSQGVEFWPALPVAPLRRGLARLDLRNHRKLAVIDGKVGYAGSVNIVNEDYGHWRAGPWVDIAGRFTGPIVASLQNVFLDDWLFETNQELDSDDLFPPLADAGPVLAQCVATGPTQESESILRVLLSAINNARHKIVLTSPYLVPDEPTLLGLAMAAGRGVEVELVIPEKSDHPLVSAAGRAYFEPLLEEGVKIFLHGPGMLHAKTMTVDDSFALLGSSNLDMRSLYLNFELNVLMYGPQMTMKLRLAQARYMNEARPLTLDQWRGRPAWKRYVDSTAALLSPLL